MLNGDFPKAVKHSKAAPVKESAEKLVMLAIPQSLHGEHKRIAATVFPRRNLRDCTADAVSAWNKRHARRAAAIANGV